VSTHGEPRTFNRLVARDRTSLMLERFLHGKLVRINPETQDVEPWLAESWTRSDDGLRYTLKLRPNVTFSDGHPFTSDDVVFSFQAVYDPAAHTALDDAMRVGGQKLQVSAPDAQTVAIVFPSAFAPGMRLLDNLPMLPRHKLEAALKAGTFASAWSLTTPPADIVGLGPFVVGQYVPGQRLIVARNPHYWRKDASGTALPYLDKVTFEVITEQDPEMLRLETGQLDTIAGELRPEDYAPLKRAADAGRVKLLDLGVAYDADMLWMNLKTGAFSRDRRAAWLQKDELRRAISMAVDRDVFANTVFLGAAVPVFGPITPANKKWYSPDAPRTPHDPAGARALLASIGLTDRNGDGTVEDAHNEPARFTLLTQKGVTSRERGAAVIRDELKKIGVTVDVVAMDLIALSNRIGSGDYDAAYFAVTTTDTDPAINLDFWLSTSGSQPWHIGQTTAATDWERRIDALMARQAASPDEGERKRLFDEVQKIFAEHLPAVYFVSPRVYVAAASRVINITPSLIYPRLLSLPDSIAVIH
jgi:peptide/nickel transport system substrate-binding protein